MPGKPVLFSPENAAVCASLSAGQEDLVREVISRAADKWSLWTLSQLATNGPLRFSRLLERVTGISQKSLTATLRQLARDGLVTRTVTVRSPIRVDYAATALGIDLVRHVDPLWTWVTRNHEVSAISRELRRNAATRGGKLECRASTAQWHAERSVRRPKPAKLAVNEVLRGYVQERLAGSMAASGGFAAAGPAVAWKGRRHGRSQSRCWAKA